MKICGTELELDIFDVETVERYESALEKMSERAKGIKCEKASESIREQCQLVFDCFDDIFGQGTAERLFQGKRNLVTCLRAFEEMVDQVGEQKATLDELVNRYSPERLQRRGIQ